MHCRLALKRQVWFSVTDVLLLVFDTFINYTLKKSSGLLN